MIAEIYEAAEVGVVFDVKCAVAFGLRVDGFFAEDVFLPRVAVFVAFFATDLGLAIFSLLFLSAELKPLFIIIEQ